MIVDLTKFYIERAVEELRSKLSDVTSFSTPFVTIVRGKYRGSEVLVAMHHYSKEVEVYINNKLVRMLHVDDMALGFEVINTVRTYFNKGWLI